MSKESFKEFVRKYPRLVDHVNNNSMTWQKFYEIYDMYGEKEEVWQKYINQDVSTSKSTSGSMNDFMNMIRGVDLETIQKGVNGLQKAIGLLQEIGPFKENNSTTQYQERPIHKYYED